MTVSGMVRHPPQARPPSSIVVAFHVCPLSVDLEKTTRVPAPGSLALGGVPVGLGMVGWMSGLAEADWHWAGSPSGLGFVGWVGSGVVAPGDRS